MADQQKDPSAKASAAQTNAQHPGIDYHVDFIWGSDQDQYTESTVSPDDTGETS